MKAATRTVDSQYLKSRRQLISIYLTTHSLDRKKKFSLDTQINRCSRDTRLVIFVYTL